PEYRALEEAGVFESLGALWVGSGSVSEGDFPVRVTVGWATHTLLPTLRVAPALGRNFTADEDLPNSRAVLLSDAFWRTHFGADPRVVNRDLLLDGMHYYVIGVLPRGFSVVLPDDTGVPAQVDVWHSTQTDIARTRANTHW